MNITISVIMSVYNGENWLKESISSVLNQTFTNFEFIIVNDGSEDTSLQIIQSFASNDNRIQVIDKMNTGVSNSRNQAIEVASGEWIANIDADDIWSAQKLDLQYKEALSNQDVVLVGTTSKEIDQEGEILRYTNYPSDNKTLKRNLFQMRKFFSHSSYFYRANIAKSLGGYRNRIKTADDYDLCLRLSELGQIICINKPLVTIRNHLLQLSHEESGNRQNLDARLALISLLLKQKGFKDPVSNNNAMSEFKEFFKFVEKEIHVLGLNKYKLFIKQLKSKLVKINFLSVISFFLLTLKSPQYVLRYFIEMIRGEMISNTVMNKWASKEIDFKK